MKKIIFAIIIHYIPIRMIIWISLCSILLVGKCYAQWYSVEDGSGEEINDIKFKDANTGWYIAGQWNIYKTTNGGINWKALDIPNVDTIKYFRYLIHIGDTLWLPIGDNRIIKSVNGGINWICIKVNDSIKVEKLQALNGTLLYGLLSKNVTGQYWLIKSTNGGLNWNIIYNFAINQVNSAIFQFLNDSVGYIKGYRTISKTTNEGLNWFVVFNDTVQSDYLYFLNENTGWLQRGNYINAGTLFRTTNGGINWYSNSENSNITEISFKNETDGFMIGNFYDTAYHGRIWKTTNGGENWQDIYSSFKYSLSFGDLELTSFNDLYITAHNYGYLVKSTNGGYNWQDLSRDSLNYGYSTIDFANSNTGFTGGPNGILMQTTNGGNNWFRNLNYREVSRNSWINRIQFTDIYTGWISASNGLYKTTNKGENWINIYSIPMFFAYSSFINNNTGWITIEEGVGNNLVIKKTTDSGEHFFEQFRTNETMISDFCFYDSLYGYVIFNYNFSGNSMYRTTNGGISWDSLNLGMLNSIFIQNRNIAYLTGDFMSNEVIFKTTNGGNNWFTIFSKPSSAWGNIKFVNDSLGFVAGMNYYNGCGLLYYTKNSGNNWFSINPGSSLGLFSFYFDNMGNGYAVGGGGKIYKTTNYGGVIGINNHNEIIPEEYVLYQNYPNPFNPSTKIKYEVKEEFRRQETEVKLIIFDILGREMKTLVNKKQKHGVYEVTFNGNNLSSGIYFYSLFIEGTLIKTRKMVMIK